MSSSKSGNSQAAIRYAKAVFELANEAGGDAIEKDLVTFKQYIESTKDLKLLINSPLISREEKEKALTVILEKAGSQTVTKNFVRILARNNRLPLINDIIDAFLVMSMQHRGEVVADVTSAVPLQGEYLAAITKALSEALGKKVKVNVIVDKKVLGGLVIKVGSIMLDNSLKGKLDRLAHIGDDADLSYAA